MALISSSALVRLKAICFCDAIPGRFYMPQIVGDKAASLNQREELLVPIQISEPPQGAFYRLLWICAYSSLRPFSRDSPAAERLKAMEESIVLTSGAEGVQRPQASSQGPVQLIECSQGVQGPQVSTKGPVQHPEYTVPSLLPILHHLICSEGTQ